MLSKKMRVSFLSEKKSFAIRTLRSRSPSCFLKLWICISSFLFSASQGLAGACLNWDLAGSGGRSVDSEAVFSGTSSKAISTLSSRLLQGGVFWPELEAVGGVQPQWRVLRELSSGDLFQSGGQSFVVVTASSQRRAFPELRWLAAESLRKLRQAVVLETRDSESSLWSWQDLFPEAKSPSARVPSSYWRHLLTSSRAKVLHLGRLQSLGEGGGWARFEKPRSESAAGTSMVRISWNRLRAPIDFNSDNFPSGTLLRLSADFPGVRELQNSRRASRTSAFYAVAILVSPSEGAFGSDPLYRLFLLPPRLASGKKSLEMHSEKLPTLPQLLNWQLMHFVTPVGYLDPQAILE